MTKAIGWLTGVLAVLAAQGCGRGGAAAGAPAGGPGAAAGMPAVPVRVAQAQKLDVPVQIHVVGSVEPLQSVMLKPQIEGRLVGIEFQEGQEMQAGDLLFRIDPLPFQAAQRHAEAELARDTALAADAAAAAQRMADAFRSGAAGQREYDQARAQSDALAAAMQADSAMVDKSKLDVEYCQIRAPIDGRTGLLQAHVGTVLKANETALVDINQIAPITVAFAVPQQYLPTIKQHQTKAPLAVEAGIAGDPGAPARGRLSFIDNKVDQQTGTIRLRATFTNEDRRLWPGQFTDTVLTVSVDQGAVVVPSTAVQNGQQGQRVFVVNPNWTVEERLVTVGRTAQDQSVIIKGLDGTETVVTEGQLRLVPGTKVESKSSPAADQGGGSGSGGGGGHAVGVAGPGAPAAAAPPAQPTGATPAPPSPAPATGGPR
jgi:multidrug efflux system membrane fusion protein